MQHLRAALACLVLGLGLSPQAEASSLRVAPISLRLGKEQGTVRVWNDDRSAVQVQVRVFRWTVVDGRDVLEPTQDVVASPPMTTLSPGGENLIRVVRVSSHPLGKAETYRLLIDELPNLHKQRAGTVNVLVRHAIPVTFSQ
jgi:fimbrial chaperone protein